MALSGIPCAAFSKISSSGRGMDEARIEDGTIAEMRTQRDDATRMVVNQEQVLRRLRDAYELEPLNSMTSSRAANGSARVSCGRARNLGQAEKQLTQTVEITAIVGRLTDFSAHVRAGLDRLDWQQRCQIIRTLVSVSRSAKKAPPWSTACCHHQPESGGAGPDREAEQPPGGQIIPLCGGVLSPLLANVLLDEVDKELERRGHAFVRYADDCNVYARSRRRGRARDGAAAAAVRGVAAPNQRDEKRGGPGVEAENSGLLILGAKDSTVRRRVADKALATMKDSIREITKRTGGRSIEQVCKRLGEYLRGWQEYFRLADTPSILTTLTDGFAVACGLST